MDYLTLVEGILVLITQLGIVPAIPLSVTVTGNPAAATPAPPGLSSAQQQKLSQYVLAAHVANKVLGG